MLKLHDNVPRVISNFIEIEVEFPLSLAVRSTPLNRHRQITFHHQPSKCRSFENRKSLSSSQDLKTHWNFSPPIGPENTCSGLMLRRGTFPILNALSLPLTIPSTLTLNSPNRGALVPEPPNLSSFSLIDKPPNHGINFQLAFNSAG